MAVSKRVRFEVFRRDNHECRYCGDAAPDAVLTIDHVVPVALGGSDEPSNLVAACKDCNAGKTSTAPDSPLVDDVSQAALAWSRAMEQAAEERSAQFANDRQVAARFTDLWYRWFWTDHQGEQQPFPLPPTYDHSVQQFLAAGLTFDDFSELVDVAMGARVARDDKWKYFCGCCWKRVRQAQERAADILTAAEAPEEVLKETPLFTVYTREDIESEHQRISALWRKKGFVLAPCECGNVGEFCGDDGCRNQVASMAWGALLGPDELIKNAQLWYAEIVGSVQGPTNSEEPPDGT